MSRHDTLVDAETVNDAGTVLAVVDERDDITERLVADRICCCLDLESRHQPACDACPCDGFRPSATANKETT